ncbi:hypothetical protein B0J14DRAFT_583464 [Halenospora varia]|nr:hypothetical protein B0J14DRAFT_583464 [Halenospora varia]
MSGTPASVINVSSSYHFAKAATAILQLAFSILTLMRVSEGEQLDFFGYCSFSLTVVPYAVMFFVNLSQTYFAHNALQYIW